MDLESEGLASQLSIPISHVNIWSSSEQFKWVTERSDAQQRAIIAFPGEGKSPVLNVKLSNVLDETICVDNIVGIQKGLIKTVATATSSPGNYERDLVESSEQNNALRIISYHLVGKLSTAKVISTCTSSRMDQSKLVKVNVDLIFSDEVELDQWFIAFKWLISPQDSPWMKEDILLKVQERSFPAKRKLLLLVNPISGKGKSLKILEEVVKPILLKEADFDVEVFITKEQNHALEYMREQSELETKFDGIVVVSGDGLMYEVIQGMMQRNDWRQVVQNISFGIIPTGTGNGLAVTFLKAVDLKLSIGDCTNNTVLVALSGRKLNAPERLDLVAIDLFSKELEAPKRYYSFLSFSWAAHGWLDIESEQARCIGDARFILWGLGAVAIARRYHGKLSFLPSVPSDKSTFKQFKTAKNSRVQTVQCYWNLPHTRDSNGPLKLEMVPKSISDPVPGSWITLESKRFLNFSYSNVSWLAAGFCTAPDTHPADGYLQFSYLDTGRADLLSLLLSLDKPGITDTKLSTFFPTRCFRFEPLDANAKLQKKGKFTRHMVLDGEDIDYEAIQGENLCGFLKVLYVPSL